MRAPRPLEGVDEDELLAAVARILVRSGKRYTQAEYTELIAINWELRLRQLLKGECRLARGQGV